MEIKEGLRDIFDYLADLRISKIIDDMFIDLGYKHPITEENIGIGDTRKQISKYRKNLTAQKKGKPRPEQIYTEFGGKVDIVKDLVHIMERQPERSDTKDIARRLFNMLYFYDKYKVIEVREQIPQELLSNYDERRIYSKEAKAYIKKYPKVRAVERWLLSKKRKEEDLKKFEKSSEELIAKRLKEDIEYKKIKLNKTVMLHERLAEFGIDDSKKWLKTYKENK